jgi:dinuclear metal center YbgI/SA1388 family protein
MGLRAVTHVREVARGGERQDGMMKRDAIVRFLDEFLDVKAHGADTGLKIPGRQDVRRVAAAVNLSLSAIEQAHGAGCDLLFAHHGARSSTDADLSDTKQGLLRDYGLSLYVSHDPLDAHPEVGTSIALACALGWRVSSTFLDETGVIAEPEGSPTVEEVTRRVGATLNVEPYLVSAGGVVELIGVVAGWGARPEWMAEAKGKGATTFLSGEAIHFGRLYARESGMNLILAGHYETELPAVRALLGRVASECEVETRLIRDETSAGL